MIRTFHRARGSVGLAQLPVVIGVICMQSAPLCGGTEKQMEQMKTEIIDVAGNKQLFIDNRFIEQKTGITLTVNPPVKAGPLSLPRDGIWAVLSIVEYNGQYFMYYAVREGACVAVSKDGLNWKDPSSDPPLQRGALVLPGTGSGVFGSVFIDPKDTNGYPFKGIFGLSEPDLWGKNLVRENHEVNDHRYKVKGEGAMYLFRSRDGLRWEIIPKIAVPFACDTVNQCFYNARLDRYVGYFRAFQDQEGLPYYGKGRIVARTEISDLMQMPWPFRKNKDRPVGPQGCYKYIHDEMDIVMGPDSLDPPWTDVYNPSVNLYPYAQDVYLAFPSIFRTYGYGDPEWREKKYGPPDRRRDIRGEESGDGLCEIHMAVSRDGKKFTRFHTAYLGPGMVTDRRGVKGESDSGWVSMGIGMVRQGDYIYQYYNSTRRTHVGFDIAGKRGIEDSKEAIFRAVLRLDGFVSIDTGSEGGEIVTPVLTFSGNRLVLNADCGGLGEIWVELQDKDGKPIPGYSLEEAISIDRNGTAQEIWWKKGPDLSDLAGKPVRLHIKMRSAKLYAFQFILDKAVRN